MELINRRSAPPRLDNINHAEGKGAACAPHHTVDAQVVLDTPAHLGGADQALNFRA